MGRELWLIEVGVPDGDVSSNVFNDLWLLYYGSWSVICVPKVLSCEVDFIKPCFGIFQECFVTFFAGFSMTVSGVLVVAKTGLVPVEDTIGFC